MIIAIPQLNYKAGDIQGNSEKIISAIQKAQNQKAELILFPELAVSGALPQDLLEREEFVNACRMAVEKIAATCTQIAAIVGAPNLDSENGIMYNSAYFIQHGEVVDGVHKNILSDYDIFSESRYFIVEKIIRRSGIKIKIYGFYSTNTNRNTSTKQIALSSLSV